MTYCFAAIRGDDNSVKVVNHVEITNGLGNAVKILMPNADINEVGNVLITESGFRKIKEWNKSDSSVYIFTGSYEQSLCVVTHYDNNMAAIFKDLIASEEIYKNTLREHGFAI
ncbi:hypothetical protein H4S04_005791 [Coemansia sp. S16]|nr:hypothetical protein H4S04_005791 [Coemansia sp. S16]KAJ2068978.1 hypothetical protein GGI08_000592 [Coemansia sp. S2]KAJ2351164.1 hypothetical protein GGH92_001982 [Coemansia sp. RSA 2673]